MYSTIQSFVLAVREYASKADEKSVETIIEDLKVLSFGAQIRWEVTSSTDLPDEAAMGHSVALECVVPEAKSSLRRLIFSMGPTCGYSTEFERRCNGLVLSWPDVQILSIGPVRTMHIQHRAAMDILTRRGSRIMEDSTITPVYDGTTVTFYNYEGQWKLSSTNGYDVTNMRWISDKTFLETALELLPEDWMNTLSPQYCYTIGFRHHSFHPLTGDAQKVWFVCRTCLEANNVLQSDQTSPHSAVQPIAPLNKSLLGNRPASFIVNACKNALDNKNSFCYGYVLNSPITPGSQGTYSNILIESQLLGFVKHSFYDAPRNVCGLDIEPSWRRNVILLNAYLRYGSFLLDWSLEKSCHDIVVDIATKITRVIDATAIALHDATYLAFIARSPHSLDQVAYKFALSFKKHVSQPSSPDMKHIVSNFIYHERDIKVFYPLLQ